MSGEMEGMMLVDDGSTPGDEGAAPEGEGQGDGAAGEQERQHHAGRQPRTERGQFNGPPGEAEKKAAPESTAPVRRKYKYTADRAKGVEVEEELTDEEVAQRLAAAKGFYKKSEELAELKRKSEQEQQATAVLKRELAEGKEPHAAMRKFLLGAGLPREKAMEVATMLLHTFIQEEDLTPEQRRLKEYEEREAEQQREAEEAEKTQRVEAFKTAVETRRQEMVSTVKAAFEKAQHGGLPINDDALSTMGRHFLINAKNGIGCTPDELVRVYEEDIDTKVTSRLKNMSPAQLKQRYGWLYRLVHKDLRDQAQAAKRGPGVGTPRPKPVTPARQQPRADPNEPILFERNL